jgi:predicted nucleic acid-binding protein
LIVYFDTSALVKLLVREEGSDLAAVLWDGTDVAVTGLLAYPEARAALASAQRTDRISRAQLSTARAGLEALWPEIDVVDPTDEVCKSAGDLAERHALRGYDAVHLASALLFRNAEVLLATWDGDLATAAVRAGIPSLSV